MRIAIERRRVALTRPELVEVVTPRTNAAVVSAAENLLAAISLPEPFALEIAATAEARWFLARARSAAMRRHLEEQLGVAYPQASLRRLDLESCPNLDPAHTGTGEQVAACALALRAPEYLPLRTFRDAEVEASRAAQADPVLGLLGALGNLPPGWRSLAQLVLRPAPHDWCRGYLRLAVEHPLAVERATYGADTSLTSVFLMAGLLVLGVVGYQAYQWYDAGDWLHLGLLGSAVLSGGPGLLWLARRLGDKPIYDPRLVQEKVARIAYVAQLRVALFAPEEAPPTEVQARLARVATAYHQFDLASGNGFVPLPLKLAGQDLREISPFGPARTRATLNTRELAGLWHLPQAQADVPLIERTTARRYLPLPFTVERGCRIGESGHQGRHVPVHLPDELLRRHLLLVAKTRRGKSSLLLQLARYLMAERPASGPRRAVVLVDPHRDLAWAALGLVPADREGAIVYVDLADERRPVGLNLIDVGLGWGRDKAVSNVLGIFRREFDKFWGPRMEDAFRFALLTLYEANEAICRAEPDGRDRQHTILAIPAVLTDPAFRRSVVGLVTDPTVRAWWSGYFELLDRRLQLEIVNPVQTKVQRFAGSMAARSIVGQARSTLEPAAWLRDGAVVIVNTAKGTVGEDTAGLIGGTLVNLVALLVAEQAALAPDRRPGVTVLLDEFHTMPGADYESILAELSKYGASLVLATQSLARIDALDREQGRALRGTLFANLDGLFAFQTSAEDARYLVRELGGGLDEQDLLELGDYQCYARLSGGGERLPTFSVRLDPPPEGDLATAQRLAAVSARRFGRDRGEVEESLRSALARIELARRSGAGAPPIGQSGVGIPPTTATNERPGPQPEVKSRPARNEHRAARRPPAASEQIGLFGEPASVGPAEASDPADLGTGGPGEARRDRSDTPGGPAGSGGGEEEIR